MSERHERHQEEKLSCKNNTQTAICVVEQNETSWTFVLSQMLTSLPKSKVLSLAIRKRQPNTKTSALVATSSSHHPLRTSNTTAIHSTSSSYLEQHRMKLLFLNHQECISSTNNTNKKCRGLINTSQHCFVNAILQALASLSSIITYLQSSVWLLLLQQQPLPHDNRLFFIDSLLELLLQLHHGFATNKRPLDGHYILNHVASHYKQFRCSSSHQQQDAEEFMIGLLNIVTKEINQYTFLLSANNTTNYTLLMHQQREQQQQQQQHDKTAALSDVIKDSSVSFLSLSQQLMELSSESTIADSNQQHQNMEENFVEEFEQNSNLHSTTTPSINSFDEEEKKSHEDDDHNHFDGIINKNKNNNNNNNSMPTHSNEIKNSTDESHTCNILLSATNQYNYEMMDSFNGTSDSNNMISSLLPTASSPFAGWLGSFLQCCTCHHVRPVQNAPFIDLPIVPTSIINLYNKQQQQQQQQQRHCSPGSPSPSSPLPHCCLEDTLHNFTSIERVTCVSCRNCAIQQAKEIVSDEVHMLQQAIRTIQNKNKQEMTTDTLQADLNSFQRTLDCLNRIHPDDDDTTTSTTTTTTNKKLSDNHVANAKSLISRQLEDNKREAFKRLLITRLPSVLCLHVQRRYYKASQSCMAKAMQLVDFPEILDVAPFTFFHDLNKNNKILYRLMSVVEHIGNANFGHYVTYRRFIASSSASMDEKWFRISDEHVQLVEWRDVKRCQAYLLFYEAL